MPNNEMRAVIDWGIHMKKLFMALVVAGGALLVAAPLNAAEGHHSNPVPGQACAEGYIEAAAIGCARRMVNGMLEVRLDGGRTLSTHGHDPVPQDGTQDQGELAAMSEVPDQSEITAFSNLPIRDVVCRQEPAYRTLAVYVFKAGNANRRDEVAPALRTRIKEMNWKLNDESLRSSAADPKRADYAFQCNDAGTITVRAVETTDTSFSGVVQRLRDPAVGLSEEQVKYLVFGDFTVAGACGLGELYAGTPPTATDDLVMSNRSNSGDIYALIYQNCWGRYSTVMHELSHMMGAVQDSAPHSSGRGHCIEGFDVMCYADYNGSPYEAGRCATVKFDCGFDDYFDTNPEYDDYLLNNWNIGWSGNRFIYIRT